MDEVAKCFRAYESCRASFEGQVAAGRLHRDVARRCQIASVVSDLGMATLSDVQLRIITALEKIRAEGTRDLRRAQSSADVVKQIQSKIETITSDNETWLTPLTTYEIAHLKLGTEISIASSELMRVNMAVVKNLVSDLPRSLTELYDSRDPSVWAAQIAGVGKAVASAFTGEIVGILEAIFEPIRKKARRLLDTSDELTSLDKYVMAVWAWSVTAEGVARICELVADAAMGVVGTAGMSADAIRADAELNVQRRFRELCAGTWRQK